MTESFRFAFCGVVLLCFVETIIQKRTRVTFYCVNLIEDFDIHAQKNRQLREIIIQRNSDRDNTT